MDARDRDSPPDYFGDYPAGAYWRAERPAGFADDGSPDYTLDGDVIRFMWDYGVLVPLWTDETDFFRPSRSG